MHSRASILIIPALMFVIAQIVSICGAFNALSALDTDGINDMSLEDIVFLDPFLRSHSDAKTILFEISDNFYNAVTTSVFYVDELVWEGPQVLEFERAKKVSGSPPGELWLTNRVLLI